MPVGWPILYASSHIWWAICESSGTHGEFEIVGWNVVIRIRMILLALTMCGQGFGVRCGCAS
jgi:hypothetical protein